MDPQVTQLSVTGPMQTAPTLDLDLEAGSRRRRTTWRMTWNAYTAVSKLADQPPELQTAALMGCLEESSL